MPKGVNRKFQPSNSFVAQNKELIIFDLDGTLASSKQQIDNEMAELLCRLLKKARVAVISGGKFSRFTEQLLDGLGCRGSLSQLVLFPVNAAEMYTFSNDGWELVYQHALDEKEKQLVGRALKKAMDSLALHHSHVPHGEIVEDRGAQITFSALGQNAPLKEKQEWNKEYNSVRLRLAKELQGALPQFEVSVGGLTSIDITRSGLDKAYGIRQIMDRLQVEKEDMLFVGDATYPGGNDYAATLTGVDYLQVSGPEEAKEIICAILDG